MDETKMRQIAREEAQNLSTRFGIPQVPKHFHNGIDSSKLSPLALTNTSTLSPQTGGVLQGQQPSNFNKSVPVVVWPVPIINAMPPSGTAAEGTLVISHNVGLNTYKLYGYANGAWRDLTLT